MGHSNGITLSRNCGPGVHIGEQCEDPQVWDGLDIESKTRTDSQPRGESTFPLPGIRDTS